jgi:D-arabinono-1,4-lactone oxidase
METLLINGVTYWLPASNNDVVALVNEAVKNNEIICVRGAAHSFPLIGTLESGSKTGKVYKYLILSKMDGVAITGDLVKVDAGCHLGPDPWDPTGTSTLENSLLYQLDQKGLSIPDLGGITHQTVGGFLSTASSGGSTQFSFEDALVSIDIVCVEDGKTAAVNTFTKGTDPEFYGAGAASMGLFGVIVSATFKCVPNFFIAGQEAITSYDDCEIDLFGPGNNPLKPDLETFFKQTQYTRIILWPQENTKRAVVWKAWQSNELAAKDWAWSNPKGDPLLLPLKPYQEVPYISLPEGKPSPTPVTLAADLIFSAMGNWPDWLLDILGDTEEYRTIRDTVNATFYPLILPELLNLFVTPDNPEKGPQKFADLWYTGLPMDNQMSDRLFPVWFTELWIDITKTQQVMTALLNFYNESDQNAGTFCCEIYASKNSAFWLSPAYNQDVIRIDVFWFANAKTGPEAYYKKFWDLLAQFNFRPHWAKYLPDSNGEQGVAYLKSNYPKWEDWMALREKMDPKQVFVNDYWRDHLGIPQL